MVVYRKNKPFKFVILGLAFTLVAISYLTERKVSAYSSGPDLGRTGAPGELTCNSPGCHSTYPTNSGPGTLTLTGLPANYSAGQEYTLTVTISQSNRDAFGFELTVLDAGNNKAGTLTATDTARTIVRTNFSNGREYLLHKFDGIAPVNGQGSWSFKWTAPATSAGKVTFYVAANAANNDGQSLFDYIYTKSFSVDPLTALAATTVSAADYSATPGLTAEGIAAVFGSKLATISNPAIGDDTDPNTPGVQLPTTLGGTTVKVKDANGTERPAPLFFVAATQINFQVPKDTVTGTATITVTAGDGTVSSGTVQIVSVAPSLFSAASTGSGPAAAQVLRVKADNSQTYESVAVFDTGQNKFVTSPISLGPDSDQLFLILYGTGIRGNTQLANASATIGGLNSEVLFAGAQGGFIGLDQVNTRIPRTVTKDQDLDIVLTLSGNASNKVTIRFTQ
ncbi:MAG TPA: choice-of-anchor V domain-containing protein [Blastocatellia bacterium]|nr:choice-of-anchor V domain-containing protein [Blastocatellia bacterium]